MVTLHRLQALVAKRVEIELEQVALNVDLGIKQASIEAAGENLPLALKEDLSELLGPVVLRRTIVEEQLRYLDQEIETARLNVQNDFQALQDMTVDTTMEAMSRLQTLEGKDDEETELGN